VDTWWQTETGAIMVTPLPGITPLKPGSCARPFFGVVPLVLDDQGKEVPRGSGGRLFLKNPWPSMLRTLWGDDARFKLQYWSELKGYYFAGDGARFDRDGYLWVVGRIDDVLNVSGHRLGTAEVESALMAHEAVAETAVVGYPHPIKGQGIYAYVVLSSDRFTGDAGTVGSLKEQVRHAIGAFAAPDVIQVVSGLPKTRSGKVMRRILRKIASSEYEGLGDVTTLADPDVVSKLVAEHKAMQG
jgi:acetyl-CoA synthetase